MLLNIIHILLKKQQKKSCFSSTVLHFLGHPSGEKNNSLAAIVLIKDLYFSFQWVWARDRDSVELLGSFYAKESLDQFCFLILTWNTCE